MHFRLIVSEVNAYYHQFSLQQLLLCYHVFPIRYCLWITSESSLMQADVSQFAIVVNLIVHVDRYSWESARMMRDGIHDIRTSHDKRFLYAPQTSPFHSGRILFNSFSEYSNHWLSYSISNRHQWTMANLTTTIFSSNNTIHSTQL